jgi:outer membrane protein OmpA-like peptidoglycan-associated protein
MEGHKKNKAMILGIGIASLLVFQGCATKKFVREHTAPLETRIMKVEDKTSRLDGQVTDLYSRTSTMNAQIADLDKRVDNLRLERQVVAALREGVNFPSGSSRLSKESRANIDTFLMGNKGMPGVHYVVVGYADKPGAARMNFDLGARRAISAAKHMITNNGIDAKRVSVRSEGATGSMGKSAMDRRVDIIAYKEVITSSPR